MNIDEYYIQVKTTEILDYLITEWEAYNNSVEDTWERFVYALNKAKNDREILDSVRRMSRDN